MSRTDTAAGTPRPGTGGLLDLAGQVAVVTGASQGIGSAVARRLAEAGASVAVHYRGNRGGARETAASIEATGGRAMAVRAELSDPDDVRTLMNSATARWGRLNIVVNAAGTFPTKALTAMERWEWDAMFTSNVTSVLHCTQEAVGPMRKAGGGAIVDIASIAALSPALRHSHYNSAKSAVVMLARSSAQELGAFGIRVNAVSPGLINRPDLEHDWPEGVARWRAKVPLQRVGEPLDVADACLFLVSPASRWITGHNLVVDGGMLCAALY
ncbi:glucose 1-dehydrogenase [Streptomyces sp. NPDC047108]|uniref:SDR family NAD(P)-dependent oxidoreductase n=1 Tax=Streptomyces sp. NPDC047108 TaxID=3155025 RepID=UPI00340CB57C